MFSYEICEIFKNIYFEGNLRTTASDATLQPMNVFIIPHFHNNSEKRFIYEQLVSRQRFYDLSLCG